MVDMLPLMRKALATGEYRVIGEYLMRHPNDKTVLDYLRHHVPKDKQEAWDRFANSTLMETGEVPDVTSPQDIIFSCYCKTPFGNLCERSIGDVQLSDKTIQSLVQIRDSDIIIRLRFDPTRRYWGSRQWCVTFKPNVSFLFDKARENT